MRYCLSILLAACLGAAARAEVVRVEIAEGLEAQAELVEVAELLGAEVWGADAGELNMSYDHPLYRGQTGHMFAEHSLPITRRGDANLE